MKEIDLLKRTRPFVTYSGLGSLVTSAVSFEVAALTTNPDVARLAAIIFLYSLAGDLAFLMVDQWIEKRIRELEGTK